MNTNASVCYLITFMTQLWLYVFIALQLFLSAREQNYSYRCDVIDYSNEPKPMRVQMIYTHIKTTHSALYTQILQHAQPAKKTTYMQ